MIKRGNKANTAGFTMLEIVVSATIITVLALTLNLVIVQSINGWSRGTSRAVADNSAALAIQKIYEDVRVGSSAAIVGSRLTVTVPRLVVDSYGERYYDASAGSTTYAYYLSNGDLYRQVGAEAARVFVSGVTELSYSVNTRGNMVTVSATGHNQSGKGGTEASRQMTAEIVLRNFQN